MKAAPVHGRLIVVWRFDAQIVTEAAGKEFGDLGEGEIVVFQPLGEGKFKLVARVAPSSRWTEWTR